MTLPETVRSAAQISVRPRPTVKWHRGSLSGRCRAVVGPLTGRCRAVVGRLSGRHGAEPPPLTPAGHSSCVNGSGRQRSGTAVIL